MLCTGGATTRYAALNPQSTDSHTFSLSPFARLIGDVVSWCTKSGRGTRLIPEGAILGASFVYAPHYVQVTGEGDLTKINVAKGDDGGELDPHGATGEGNPVGGLVFHCTKGKCIQMHEWAMFMSDTEFCFRACYDGDRATSLCRHTYDTLGCRFNMPANYPDVSKSNDSTRWLPEQATPATLCACRDAVTVAVTASCV